MTKQTDPSNMMQIMSDVFAWRYLAYCEAHGNNPTSQLAADRKMWPGGSMTGYMLWVNRQWGAFATRIGKNRRDWQLQLLQREFDQFIAAQLGGHEA